MPNITYAATDTPNTLFRLTDGQIDAIIAAGGKITYIGNEEWVVVSATPTFPVIAGMNLMVDTRTAGVSITLPTSGTVRLIDYMLTFGTSPLTIIPNAAGPQIINGHAVTTGTGWYTVSTSGLSLTCTYIDGVVGYRCY